MSVYVLHDGESNKIASLTEFGIRHGTSIQEASPADTVIRWGDSAHGFDNRAYRRVINASRYTERLLDWDGVRRLLALYGIQSSPLRSRSPIQTAGIWLPPPHKKRFSVLVFDMRVLDIQCLTDLEDGLNQLDNPSFNRRIGRLAVRAVYAVGLDYAAVTLVCIHSHLYAVERIEAFPKLNQAKNRLLIEAIVSLQETKNNSSMATKSEVMLGMDPEFVLINSKGKIVPANRFFSYKGSAGYDSATVRGRNGVHPLVELRPDPSGDPDGLIRNLRRTMWTAARRIHDPTIRWIAGGMPIPGLPLGGHIHLSGVVLNGELVRAMDNYLALPLLMIEHSQAIARRKRYGKLGDIREKSYGGFEYRTLPSLLLSPTLTKGTIALTMLIATHYEQLQSRPLGHEDVVRAYMNGEKETLARTIDQLLEEVRRIPDFSQYSSYLTPLYKWIEVRRTWDEQVDFRSLWRIPPFS